jgi:uncharacterized protein (TIGR02147 family)
MNYHKFLNAVYQEKKAKNPNFSFQVFANKAGLKSKSFIKEVISGQKNLTDDSIEKVNRVLKLQGSALSYLEDLVAFDRARSHKDRNYYFQRILTYKKSSPAKVILQHQYEFYSQWYHNTIREVVTLFDFREDYELLGKMVKPAITAFQAHRSVKLLLKLGLIKKTRTGYKQTSPAITTGNEVLSMAAHNFHVQNMHLMAEALDTASPNDRDISCLIMGLSRDGFAKIKARVQEFRKELMEIALHDKKSTRVYHVNFQIAPTSEELEGRVL